MNETLTLVLATAITTSLTTVGLIYCLYVFFLRKRVERRMQELAASVQERVRLGAIDAGQELLPRFREQVTEGFKRALREWSANDFKKMTRSGMDMVEESLSSLLGARGKRHSDDD